MAKNVGPSRIFRETQTWEFTEVSRNGKLIQPAFRRLLQGVEREDFKHLQTIAKTKDIHKY